MLLVVKRVRERFRAGFDWHNVTFLDMQQRSVRIQFLLYDVGGLDAQKQDIPAQ
jgi:hypothetical protein